LIAYNALRQKALLSAVKLSIYSGTERRDWLRQRALTIVIAIAFLFMAAINFAQGHVIESQRALIRALSGDSSQLALLRVQQIKRQH
jgi:hypothetical protein